MTSAEIIDAAYSLHLALTVTAIPIFIYVMKGELLEKQIDRATSLSASLRANVALALARELERFVTVSGRNVAQVSSLVLNADGNPAQPAELEPANVVDSEGFRDAVRACLDDRSPVMRKYLCAQSLEGILVTLQVCLAWITGAWLLLSLLAATFFYLCKQRVVTEVTEPWLLAIVMIAAAPAVLALFSIPTISVSISRLAYLNRQ